jgi:beta-catenin-like protein 1
VSETNLLGIFENILGFNPQLAETLVSKTDILPWLLRRIESKAHDENRGYAAEMISIMVQNNRPNRLELGKRDGIETILKVLSVRVFLLSTPLDIILRHLAIPEKRSSRCR